MDLPVLELGDDPLRHPHSCLSFSIPFFETITHALPKTTGERQTVLSIGSGTGLLEAVWLHHIEPRAHAEPSLKIEGVEVQQSGSRYAVNKYLPEHAINAVRGTWDISARLQDEDILALVFVYPRQPDLVSRYIKVIVEENLGIEAVVWLGPAADWGVFEPSFTPLSKDNTQKVEVLHGGVIGLDENEMMAVWKQ